MTATETATRGQLADPTLALAAILAGKARITLVSRATGARYTYRVKATERGDAYFVSLLTGPSNEQDYTYIGILRGAPLQLRQTAKSKLAPDAAPFRAMDWALAVLQRGVMPEQLEVWHEGRCCHCGRALTVPSSIASGIGPTCAGKRR